MNEENVLRQYITYLQGQVNKTVIEARVTSNQVTFRGSKNTTLKCGIVLARYKSLISCHIIWLAKKYSRGEYWVLSRKWRDANAFAYLAVPTKGNGRAFCGRPDVIKLQDYYLVRL